MRKDVGVIIPAYNEEENLPKVMDSILPLPWIKEFILVDDGSTDGTLSVAERYAKEDARVLVRRLPENKGKALAMLTGVRSAACEWVLFLDADLIGLTVGHLEGIVDPVQKGQAQMAVGSFYPVWWLRGQTMIVNPFSGQRCLWRRDAERALELLQDSGYGVEAGLTIYARDHHWCVEYIPWKNLIHVKKEEKRGWLQGYISRWAMYLQVALTILGIRNLLPCKYKMQT